MPETTDWMISSNEERVWSSAAGAYVEQLPEGWYANIRGAVWAVENENSVNVPTRIASEAEMDEVQSSL